MLNPLSIGVADLARIFVFYGAIKFSADDATPHPQQ